MMNIRFGKELIRVVSIAIAAFGGVALGVFGLYIGYKLARFRPHRKSQEIQTLFSRNKLD
jgi:hypothetical protein